MSTLKDRPPQRRECEDVSQLESRIRRELCAVTYPCFRHIGCIIRDGVLVLSGRLPSYYLKQVAQTVVRPHLEPAMMIDNQIFVDRHSERRNNVRS